MPRVTTPPSGYPQAQGLLAEKRPFFLLRLWRSLRAGSPRRPSAAPTPPQAQPLSAKQLSVPAHWRRVDPEQLRAAWQAGTAPSHLRPDCDGQSLQLYAGFEKLCKQAKRAELDQMQQQLRDYLTQHKATLLVYPEVMAGLVDMDIRLGGELAARRDKVDAAVNQALNAVFMQNWDEVEYPLMRAFRAAQNCEGGALGQERDDRAGRLLLKRLGALCPQAQLWQALVLHAPLDLRELFYRLAGPKQDGADMTPQPMALEQALADPLYSDQALVDALAAPDDPRHVAALARAQRNHLGDMVDRVAESWLASAGRGKLESDLPAFEQLHNSLRLALATAPAGADFVVRVQERLGEHLRAAPFGVLALLVREWSPMAEATAQHAEQRELLESLQEVVVEPVYHARRRQIGSEYCKVLLKQAGQALESGGSVTTSLLKSLQDEYALHLRTSGCAEEDVNKIAEGEALSELARQLGQLEAPLLAELIRSLPAADALALKAKAKAAPESALAQVLAQDRQRRMAEHEVQDILHDSVNLLRLLNKAEQGAFKMPLLSGVLTALHGGIKEAKFDVARSALAAADLCAAVTAPVLAQLPLAQLAQLRDCLSWLAALAPAEVAQKSAELAEELTRRRQELVQREAQLLALLSEQLTQAAAGAALAAPPPSAQANLAALAALQEQLALTDAGEAQPLLGSAACHLLDDMAQKLSMEQLLQWEERAQDGSADQLAEMAPGMAIWQQAQAIFGAAGRRRVVELALDVSRSLAQLAPAGGAQSPRDLDIEMANQVLASAWHDIEVGAAAPPHVMQASHLYSRKVFSILAQLTPQQLQPVLLQLDVRKVDLLATLGGTEGRLPAEAVVASKRGKDQQEQLATVSEALLTALDSSAAASVAFDLARLPLLSESLSGAVALVRMIVADYPAGTPLPQALQRRFASLAHSINHYAGMQQESFLRHLDDELLASLDSLYEAGAIVDDNAARTERQRRAEERTAAQQQAVEAAAAAASALPPASGNGGAAAGRQSPVQDLLNRLRGKR